MSDEIPSFLDVTPFGPYCKICNLSLSIQKGIMIHGKEFHPESSFTNATVIRSVQRQMEVLRETHANDLTPFVTDKPALHPTWFCTSCFSSFTKSCNYNRHFELRNNTCFGAFGGKMPCYITICGRLAPKTCSSGPVPNPMSNLTIVSEGTSVSILTDITSQSSTNKSLDVDPTSKVPTPLLTTQDEASKILEPFVRPDEDVQDLCLIYYPLLTNGFEGQMRQFLEYSSHQAGEDGILFKWIEAGREWLGKYAAGHIANISANVRSRLAEFEQKELDNVVTGTRTFTLRRGIPRLMNDLDSALRFFYRYPTTLFDRFKSKEVQTSSKDWMIESAIIPKILFTAAAEEPDDHGRLPIACLYALSRGFAMKRGYDLHMNECGWFGSRLSALLHLLRAGVCGYLVTLSGNKSSSVLTLQEMDIVGQIQNGRVTNLLAPYVKRLRDLNSRKPPLKTNTVNVNGDITSGSFTFPYSVWSNLIPRVVAIAKACFDEVFENDQWKLFLEKPINMSDWVQLEAFVVGDSCQVCLCDLGVKNNVEPVLARLQSLAELCFLGFGVGAVRHEEVMRLTILSCQWHNSYLYFWSESLKRGSLKVSSKPKMVEHRLSLSISKIIVLIRYVMKVSSEIENKMLFPNYPDASMLGLLQDIFDFDCQPHMLNARHLFTSIGNIIMPDNDMLGSDGCLVSMPFLTEKSGHTQGTGRRAYGTWLEKTDEILYDRYHSHLGEVLMDPPVVDFTPFSDAILKASLKELVGQKAVYRSSDQKRMIHIAANSVVRHSFVGLPCGQGKSLSWMVPTMASYLSGRHIGLRIIILPYKFLLGHMVHRAMSMLGLLKEKLTVSFLDSSQITKEVFPDVLTVNEVPSLLFLNLDGAAALLRFHLARLQSMASQNVLKRVYLDEFQQLVVEYGFRSSYQCLRDLGRIGVPVMCLSGSLPFQTAMSLMTYCGLSQNMDGESLDVVQPTDPIGDGFSFDVVVVNDVTTAIVDYVINSRVGACHVLCSSVSMVLSVSDQLSKELKVLSVTSSSGYQEQIECAEAWFKGNYDVLVSTVIGLVGNENKFCKTIVVGGFLFNVSSLVQAIGRLRPTQRGPDSRVQVFRYPFCKKDLVERSEKSDQLFSELYDARCLIEDNKEEFMKIFAPIGLQKLLSMEKGCYLQQLSSYYGFARSPCYRCGLCSKLDQKNSSHPVGQMTPAEFGEKSPVVVNPYKKRSPVNEACNVSPKKKRVDDANNVRLSQRKSQEAVQVSKLLRRKTKWVLSELLYRCLVCGTVDCNGEMCLKACYRCGDKSHNKNACPFNTEKLTKILANKGVCFGCFDTLQHTMVKHEITACPLKKRLMRLLFVDRGRKGKEFDVYLRELYASELSFVSVVASFSKDTILAREWAVPRKDLITLACDQMKHDLPETPLLPPDMIHNSSDISCDGTRRSTRFQDEKKARATYNTLRTKKLSCKRHRKFAFGAIYDSIFPGYFEVDPFVADYDLVVTLHSSEESVIKVRLVSPTDGVGKNNLLAAIVSLGRSLKFPGNARGAKVGDIGKMHAVGLQSASSKVIYKITDEACSKASVASSVMREWLEDNMQDVLSELLRVDADLKIVYPPSMPRGPGSRMMLSVNLANSPHYDVGDTSTSIGIWAEEKPGQSENWFFVLPNLSYKGSKGVVIRLVHGAVISWDGRKIYHCTSKTNTGKGNKVFGCMWGSSRT